MALLSIPELITKASAAFKRFPITLLWAIAGSLFVIGIIEFDENALFDDYLNEILVLALGISWFISAQFYNEQHKSPYKYWWTKLLVILFLLAVYFTLPIEKDADVGTVSYIRLVLFFLAGHLAIFFTPFVYTWHSKSYANYLGTILISLARSILFSGVLYLGLILALAAVEFLFKVDIDGKRYGQLFVMCLGIVNTWVYLSDFPKEVHHNIHFSFPKPAEVFVKYILIPLVALYYIILYAYCFKIISNWELPNGWVSYLVTALAGLLFVIQLIINPIQSSHPSRLIRKFHPFFYWLLLPLLILLFVAIYRRTSEYGLTENRYFVWVLAFFILGTTLYLLFSKKRQLRFLPMALFGLAMLTSMGPWSASAVSIKSQLKQFEDLYEGAFAKAQSENPILPVQQYDRIQSITKFLANRNAIDRANSVLGYKPTEAFNTNKPWDVSYKILDTLNIKRENDLTINRNTNYYYARQFQELNISGFDYFKQIDIYKNSAAPYNTINGYNIKLKDSGKSLLISKENESDILISLEDLIQKLTSQNQQNDLDPNLLMVEGGNNTVRIRIYFSGITFSNQHSKLIGNGLNAFVFIKELDND